MCISASLNKEGAGGGLIKIKFQFKITSFYPDLAANALIFQKSSQSVVQTNTPPTFIDTPARYI
jgi:hypothetical protein